MCGGIERTWVGCQTGSVSASEFWRSESEAGKAYWARAGGTCLLDDPTPESGRGMESSVLKMGNGAWMKVKANVNR